MESGVDILQYLEQFEVEENKGRSASKVSKIATMFQLPSEEERDERDGSAPQVTVVRTESHVARFNTARALFEKMAEKKAEESKCSKAAQRRAISSQHGVYPACRSIPSQASGKAKSRSPSPASTHSTHSTHHHHHHHAHHQPNGHSFNSSSNQTSISTITSSSYSHTPSTFHSSVQNPSIPSVLPLSVRSTLESDTYKGKRHHAAVVAEIPKSNLDIKIKSEIPKSHNESSQVNCREHIGTGNKSFVNSVNNKYEEGHNEALHRNYEHSTGKKTEPKSRPNSLIKPDKPVKPETLIDKPLSSHLQNQQIIQRHKNWFQSFSKIKSPATSPVKPHQPPSPTSKTSNIYEQRNHSEEPPGVHNDWRRERSAILMGSGRSSRSEDTDKNSIAGTNAKNFENVPTLPSCWSPPKQYNDLSSTQGDKEHHGGQEAIYSSGKPGEDYRRDPSPSNVDNIGVIPDISKDSLNRRHNAHDKHIPGVFKKGHDNTASSPSLSRHETSNRNIEYENSRDNVVLRHRDDMSLEKEKRLKEWEKRLSQRDVQFHTFPDSKSDRNSTEIPSSSSISRLEFQFKDSKPERKDGERKERKEEELRKKSNEEKRREDIGKEENYVHQRHYDEEQERRKLKLQTEKERLTKEDDRNKMRKDDRRERLRNDLERKDNERKEEPERIRKDEEISKGEKEKLNKKEEKFREQDEREKLRREEQAKLKLRKETEQRDRLMREAEEHERRWREEEKREKLKREEESREKLKREMEEEERFKRELEEEDRLKREEGRLSLRREEEKERLRKKEEREKLKREKEEMERMKKEEEKEKLRREEEERVRLKKEEKREILRREEEERNRLRKEEEERARLRKEEEKREKLRREEEERERIKREIEERERLKREVEEREKLRREAEERERLRREAEEQERLRREEEERENLRREKEEKERLRREEEERERLKREKEEEERLQREEERLRREEVEREKLKKEKEEKERLRKEEERLKREMEQRERLRREEEEREKERLIMEEELRERERLRREEEQRERERLRREEKQRERERLRREEEQRERERLRREEEERERLRREEEEKERLRREEEELERFRKEEEERERLRRENEEIMRLKREEEMERLRIEEEKRERLKRENEERERLRKEKEERQRLRKEKERERQRREAEEERLCREEEEFERLREQEERERREEDSQRGSDRLKGAVEEQINLGNEENIDHVEINLKKELEKKWQAKREKLEEEERIRREKDRIEIEKTKNRIAELKRERDELQRQQAMRLCMMIKEDPDLSNKETPALNELTPDDDLAEVEVTYPKRSLPVLQNKDANVELVKGEATSPTDSRTPKISISYVDVGSQVSNGQVAPTELIECTEVRIEANVRKVEESFSKSSAKEFEDEPKDIEEGIEDIAYDHTVMSAQHKLEFCTSSYNESISKESEEKNAPNQGHFSSSTLSSEFEPLPPPVPPHNVDPATLATEVCIEQQRLPPLPVDAEPEIMTPEEAEKLLSHNIVETRKVLLAEAGELEISNASSPQRPSNASSTQRPFSPEGENDREVVDGGANTTKPVQDDAFDKDYDSVCVDSPTPDYDEDDSYGYFKHEVNEEGFVVRAKEVLNEDGVHYLEDGHFWIQVPGLTEDDDEELPESVPVHKHTKLKFSKDPIRLFSTFSVTDYDRRNDDVDPVAASAEYELEKRVEKMNVFPVTIDKGEGGLGLSIIGMGVGADAGVEKLGIFVKTITPEGATDKDGRIQVNDQIIEVDNQSLVGVTQMFAASVLKNTNGTVNFLIGRENDPENSEVAMLIRQSLMADQERDERRRALEGPNYDPRNSGGIFESFSSQSGGESPSEEAPRNGYVQREGHQDPNLYGQDFGEQYGDPYGSCPSTPPEGISSPPPEAYNHDVQGRELLLQNNEIIIMSQHLQEIQHRNDMYEEEITILRNKICDLEKELGTTSDLTKRIQDTTTKLKELEDTLQSRQVEISTYQDMLEQSQGQYIILEKKYYKAKKIIKEYQSRERDFLHREEYHITQLEEKDALYNSLVKALKDRVIQLEGDLIKAQQEAGLPVKVPPDLNSQSSNFVQSKGQDNHSAVQKIPSKEELDVAVPPTELLDISLSKAKGELASRGHLANRQLPSLKKSASNASANSFEHSFDELDDSLPESQQPQNQAITPSKSPTSSTFHSDESSIHSTPSTSTAPNSQSPVQGSIIYGGRTQPPPPYQATHTQGNQTTAHPSSPHHQPPPYQPPPSAPLSYRPGISSDTQSGRSDAPYRHQPPIARVQPVNRVEGVQSSHSLNSQQHQQTLAYQLKALLAEREANPEAMQEGNKDNTPLKKSPSSLMEDVRRAVIQADMSIGKKPVISGPIHVSSTAQVVSTGQFVHSRTSPQKGSSVGAAFQQKISRDSGTWSPVSASNSPGSVVLLSQRPIDTSLPLTQSSEAGESFDEWDGSATRPTLVSTDSASSFELPPQGIPSGRSPKEILSVFDWTKEQVAQWLVIQGLENYVSTFVSAGITGPRLVNIDTKDLKNLGLSSDDKNRIKRKVKELRQNLERERKQMEKENKEREKLQRKAEKLAEKAEKRKK